jgi:hypothetical protein
MLIIGAVVAYRGKRRPTRRVVKRDSMDTLETFETVIPSLQSSSIMSGPRRPRMSRAEFEMTPDLYHAMPVMPESLLTSNEFTSIVIPNATLLTPEAAKTVQGVTEVKRPGASAFAQMKSLFIEVAEDEAKESNTLKSEAKESEAKESDVEESLAEDTEAGDSDAEDSTVEDTEVESEAEESETESEYNLEKLK